VMVPIIHQMDSINQIHRIQEKKHNEKKKDHPLCPSE